MLFTSTKSHDALMNVRTFGDIYDVFESDLVEIFGKGYPSVASFGGVDDTAFGKVGYDRTEVFVGDIELFAELFGFEHFIILCRHVGKKFDSVLRCFAKMHPKSFFKADFTQTFVMKSKEKSSLHFSQENIKFCLLCRELVV